MKKSETLLLSTSYSILTFLLLIYAGFFAKKYIPSLPNVENNVILWISCIASLLVFVYNFIGTFDRRLYQAVNRIRQGHEYRFYVITQVVVILLVGSFFYRVTEKTAMDYLLVFLGAGLSIYLDRYLILRAKKVTHQDYRDLSRVCHLSFYERLTTALNRIVK